MVLNFMVRKDLPPLPHRSCIKKIGPPSSKYMASEIISHRGLEAIRPKSANVKSKGLLKKDSVGGIKWPCQCETIARVQKITHFRLPIVFKMAYKATGPFQKRKIC